MQAAQTLYRTIAITSPGLPIHCVDLYCILSGVGHATCSQCTVLSMRQSKASIFGASRCAVFDHSMQPVIALNCRCALQTKEDDASNEVWKLPMRSMLQQRMGQGVIALHDICIAPGPGLLNSNQPDHQPSPASEAHAFNSRTDPVAVLLASCPCPASSSALQTQGRTCVRAQPLCIVDQSGLAAPRELRCRPRQRWDSRHGIATQKPV